MERLETKNAVDDYQMLCKQLLASHPFASFELYHEVSHYIDTLESVLLPERAEMSLSVVAGSCGSVAAYHQKEPHNA